MTISTRPVPTVPAEPHDGRAVAILGRPEPIIVLSAIAGSGKTTLLRQIAERAAATILTGPFQAPTKPTLTLLWDLSRHRPDTAEGRAFFEWIEADARRRAVIAKRPAAVIDGLDRAVLYGNATILDFNALATLVDIEVPSHGRWDALGGGMAPDGLGAFLETELLAELSDAAIAALDMLLRAAGTVHLPSIDPALGHELRQLAPVVRHDPDQPDNYAIGIPTLRGELASAVASVISRNGQTGSARARAQLLRDGGLVTEAIAVLQRAGLHALALEWFAEASGYNYIYFHGYEAFDRVLAGFPDEMARDSEVLTFSLALQALKSGNLQRARLLLSDRFGSDVHNLPKVYAPGTEFGLASRSFRMILMIYEEVTVSDRTLEHMFNLLAEYPVHDYLRRGAFYNAVLEIYVRRRRFAEAESIAERALYNYNLAGAHLLAFYIHIFRAALALMQGDVRQARFAAEAGRDCMALLPFETPSDDRILQLLDACIAYEDGNIEPLALFLSGDLDNFAMGEIWPSLVEFTIQYGSQTLSRHLSTFAARSFLERWRILQWQSRRFRMMIEMREAAILQNGNRWLEASETLSALQSRINRTWVEAAVDQLARISDRDELVLAISWLRHLVHEVPMRRELQSQIAALLINDHVTNRQKIALLVWGAYAARRQRDLTSARATLLKAYEEAARLACIAPLIEEMVFLKELTQDKRISDFLQSSPMARQVARRLDAIDVPTTTTAANTAGLSRREVRVLLLIAEGGSNKFVARHLGISEATVKFHLSNLYRKLGCTRRREAIAAARALRLIA